MKTFKGRGRNLAQNRKHGEKREKQQGVEVSVYWGVSAHHDSQKWVCPRPPKLMGMSCVLPNKMSSWNQQSARWIC